MPEETKAPTSRAKFYVESVTLQQGGGQTLNMRAICADEIEENRRFNQASPNGTLQLWVNNPALKGAFRPGQRFYLDFTEAPDSPQE